MNKIIKQSDIENRIFTVRGLQVMLDSHLAELYGVETKQINRAVKRNTERFPAAFVFQLTEEEWDDLKFQIGTSNTESVLRSQIVTLEKDELLRSQNATIENNNSLRFQNDTLNTGRGQHRKYLPYVFTEQGVAMLSAVLHSETLIPLTEVLEVSGKTVASGASTTVIYRTSTPAKINNYFHEKSF